MKATLPGTTHHGRQPLAPLGKLTAAALLGAAIGYAALQALIPVLTAPVLIVMVVMLVLAGSVLSGWRWTPLLAGLLAALGIIIGNIVAPGYTIYHLTHPDEFGFFAVTVFILACSVLAAVAGISAGLQNYRGGARTTPGWVPALLTGLAGFVVGALVVAEIVAATARSATAGTIVHMGPATFVQSSASVPTGATVQLVDDGAFPHVIRNGSWDGNTARPTSEPGAPLADNLTTNGQPLTIGPFATAGTFHFSCTVHPGMNLTVTVR
jgi:plastocyanin